MSSPDLHAALLANYRDGQGTLSSGAVYHDIAAFWPHYEVNYGAHFAPLPRSAEILDVGCGPGSLLSWLRSNGFTAIQGVDLSPDDVDVAAGVLGPGVVVLGDAVAHLEERPGAFDVIVMKAMLEHVAKAELLRLVEAVAAALRPTGFALIEVPNMDWLAAGHERYMDLTHEVGFTQESLCSLLQLAFGSVTVTGSRIGAPTRSQRLLRRPAVAFLRRLLYVVGEGANDTLFAHRSLIARAERGPVP
jgi:2-polyprenyl-3-methyl-5-hydroxy-6-metoxy-1,4-benzoquinol methylase